MEEEQLQPTPEATPEPTPDPVPDNVGQTDPAPAETDDDAFSENLANTGLPEPTPDPENNFNDENAEENVKVEDQEQTGYDDQTDGETDTEEEGGGSTTNITIIRPPAQITYNTNTDPEATYHATIENETDSPVPVLVTETLIEPDPVPGIMEKKLEDYTVTEALLLLILLTLWLRMIFDYFGRRRT